MKFEEKCLLLYAITDRSWNKGRVLYEQIEEALAGGATMVQLREKTLSESDLIREAKQVKSLCNRFGAPLVIDDNVAAAIKSGADGVHLGQEDDAVSDVRKLAGDGFIIGATAKTVEQAQFAEQSGADYLGVGAVFTSATKKNAIRVTKEQLCKIVSSVKIPAVAIGGINACNVLELKNTGICGIAVVSAIFSRSNIQESTKELKGLAQQCVRKRGVML